MAARVPPGLGQGFPVLTYGETPVIRAEEGQLRIWGAVEKEVVITGKGLLALPQHTLTQAFCLAIRGL
ncbi:MAG: hypothetical protein Q6K80_10530 [Thermostichus sp. DG_1_6_bins_120]